MWPSAGYALAWVQMRNRKPKGPPPMPEDTNGKDAALWALILHVNGRVDGLYGLFISGMVAGTLAAIAIFVTVLLK